MRRRIAPVVAVVLLGAPAASRAQGLTIDALVAMALERSPVLHAVRTTVDAAEGGVAEADLRPNLMVGGSYQDTLNGPGRQTVVQTQVPLDLFRREARVTTAREGVAVASLSVADRERLLAASVRELAGRVLEQERRLLILDELVDINRQLRDLTEARVREGALPRIDLEILEVELERAEAEAELQIARVEAALIELRVTVGLEPDSTVVVAGSLEQAVEDPSAAPDPGAGTTARSAAVADRADVRASMARVSLADARLEQTRREGRLDASLVAEYGHLKMAFPMSAFDQTGALVPIRGLFHNLRVGVMVNVPIWDRNQGSVAAATADRARAAHEADARLLEARAEVAVAEARERAARRAVGLYRGGARDGARRNLEVIREAYELGRNTLVDVLAEQQRFLDVEMAYVQALAEAYQARTALRRATGDVR